MPHREHDNIVYDARDVYQFEQLGFVLPERQTHVQAIDLAMHISAEGARLTERNVASEAYDDVTDRAERAGRVAAEIFGLFPPAYRLFLIGESAARMKSDE